MNYQANSKRYSEMQYSRCGNSGLLLLHSIPEDSRVAKALGFLKHEHITPERIEKVKKLNEIAARRGQKMSQMALAWLLKDNRVTSVIIGASKVSQIEEAVAIQENLNFSSEELAEIETILKS